MRGPSSSTLLVAILGVSVVATGCTSGHDPTQPQVAQEVPSDAALVQQGGVETVLTRTVQAIRERRRQVVETQAQWEAVWEELNANVLPQSPAPAVDLSDHVLLVLAMGGRPTGGYSISAESVSRKDTDLWVTVVERSPGPGCIVTQATTAPLTAVLVPRMGGQIFLVERQEQTDCG